MEANRIYNFNPGPATLPLEVLKEAQAEFLNFRNSGMSILEISHRAKAYDEVHNQAKADILSLMGLGDDYDVRHGRDELCDEGEKGQLCAVGQLRDEGLR